MYFLPKMLGEIFCCSKFIIFSNIYLLCTFSIKLCFFISLSYERVNWGIIVTTHGFVTCNLILSRNFMRNWMNIFVKSSCYLHKFKTWSWKRFFHKHFVWSRKGIVYNFNTLTFTLRYLINKFFPRDIFSKEPVDYIHKVEGLHGIYITSQIAYPVISNVVGPEHLVTKITFDYGANWELITPPERDQEGQLTSCSLQNNCSLHFIQGLNPLHLDVTTDIFSSSSAPGIIVATGVLGTSLEVIIWFLWIDI